jgi:hypothetical protein
MRPAVGHFYFDFKERVKLFEDKEGLELPSLDAARQEARKTARELLAEAIKAAKAQVPEALVIADQDGRTLEVLPLASVLPPSLK